MTSKTQPTPNTFGEVLVYTNRINTLCDQIKGKMGDRWTGWDLDKAQTLTTELRALLAALRRWAN